MEAKINADSEREINQEFHSPLGANNVHEHDEDQDRLDQEIDKRFPRF